MHCWWVWVCISVCMCVCVFVYVCVRCVARASMYRYVRARAYVCVYIYVRCQSKGAATHRISTHLLYAHLYESRIWKPLLSTYLFATNTPISLSDLCCYFWHDNNATVLSGSYCDPTAILPGEWRSLNEFTPSVFAEQTRSADPADPTETRSHRNHLARSPEES